MSDDNEALRYHQQPRPGKIEVVPLKPCLTQSEYLPRGPGRAGHPDQPGDEGAAVKALARQPDLVIDGEMQADTAVAAEILARDFPFNQLGGPANIRIFPDLAAGNIACKLLEHLGGAKAVRSLLMGISKPFNVLQRNIDMETVFNVIAITVMQAQSLSADADTLGRDVSGAKP